MVTKTAVLVLSVAVSTLSGCGTYPQTREAFIDTTMNYNGVMKSWMVTDSGTVATPYDKAINNVESQVATCISGDMERSMAGATFVRIYQQNNPTFTRVDDNRAELTVQQIHTSTFGQPDGGFYLLAANMTRTSEDQTQLDIYSSTHYQPVIDAVKAWTAGSTACHGVGGKD